MGTADLAGHLCEGRRLGPVWSANPGDSNNRQIFRTQGVFDVSADQADLMTIGAQTSCKPCRIPFSTTAKAINLSSHQCNSHYVMSVCSLSAYPNRQDDSDSGGP